MRILVIQTTRMGDTLQTSPLTRVLRQRHPDAHITFMVRDMGKAIAERNPDVDEVFIYDEDAMFVDLRSDDSNNYLAAYKIADGYASRIAQGNYDIVYNCTHSIPSAMLLKAAGVKKVAGAHMSDDWQYLLRGKWTRYFFTSVFHRMYSDINLCDVMRNLMDDAPPCPRLVFDVRDEDRANANAVLEQNGIGPDDFVACFQLGASDDAKRWPVANFTDLGRLLVDKHNAKIILLGVKDEASLGEAFENLAPGLGLQLFGKTSIAQLAALLERANLLVTNDTGTMHIAAAAGCPIVLVSVGYVHFRETGPYGAGHCAVELRREGVDRMDHAAQSAEERAMIRPQHVMRAVDLVLGFAPDSPVPGFIETSDISSVDIYQARFAPDGFLEWYPVVRRPLLEVDFLRVVYRVMWLTHLCSSFVQTAPDGSLLPEGKTHGDPLNAGLRRLLECYTKTNGTQVDSWRDKWALLFNDLAGLARRGADMTETLIDLLRRRCSMRTAKELVDELVQLDHDIRLMGELHEGCKPLCGIMRFEREKLEGADPLVLAQATLEIYRGLAERAGLLAEKTQVVSRTWHDQAKDR